MKSVIFVLFALGVAGYTLHQEELLNRSSMCYNYYVKVNGKS
jgi:hypothetical protein